MINVTEQLAHFAARLQFDHLPSDVVEKAKILFLDTAGIMIRAQNLDSTLAMKDALRALQGNCGTVHVLGSDERWTPQAAAHLAGTAAHSLDFDDTHARAQLHPGAPIIAAALAAVQLCNGTTRDLLTGIVAGYEVMIRVALGAVALAHSERGFHPSATIGVFGAAAAAGRILGLTPKQMEHAFGTALSQSAGTGQFSVNGAWTKRYHVGYAAAGGLTAAVFASKDYTGATQAFEGREGFFNVYSPRPQPELAVQALGTVWEILESGLKPWPCCRGIHAPLDAVMLLHQQRDIDIAEIERVRVGMAKRSVYVVGEPQDRRRRPKNVVDCQFSTHLCLSIALKHKRMGWDDYEPALHDPDIFALMQKIDVYEDAEAEANFPEAFSGVVEISFTDGSTLREFVRVPLGEPSTPYGMNELRAKYSQLVQPTLGATAEAAFFELVQRLDDELPASTLFCQTTQPDIQALA